MSIYMDDVSVAGGPEEVKKRIMKCARTEVEKMTYSLSKTNYMVVKKRKNISGRVKVGKIQRTKKLKYLGITINEQRNIKERIEKLKQKCETISQEGVDKSAIKTF